jgi:hypothetical protein
MKPGWKTTEFWLSLAANAVGVLSVAGQLPVPDNMKSGAQTAGAIITATATAAYAISRALAKKAPPPTP